MTRVELAFLSNAHAVALSAMVAEETRAVPFAAARVLVESAAVEMPELARPCAAFHARLQSSHGRLRDVADAGRALRDAVAGAMAFRPVDAQRVDLHG